MYNVVGLLAHMTCYGDLMPHDMWSRVYETVRCPSVRLSVPSIDRCSSVRRFAAGRPAGGRYRLTAAGARLQRRGRSTAHSNAAVGSKREQCHVYSRRRRLNTVDLHSYMLSTVTEQFSVVCVHSKRITKYQYVQRGRPAYTRDVLSTASIVCGAGSMKRYGVSPSVPAWAYGSKFAWLVGWSRV